MTNNNIYNQIILTNHIKERLQERNIEPAIVGESLKTYIDKKQKTEHNNKNVMLINKKANTSILIEVLANKIRLVTVINKLAWTKKDTIRVYI